MNHSPDKKHSSRGPDFLCIGMQKAGTGFLYECLESMPAFRMPIRKEIHHFDKFPRIHPGGRRLLEQVARQLGRNAATLGELSEFYAALKERPLFRKRVKVPNAKGRFVLDDIMIEFLRRLCHYVVNDGGHDAYLDLFSPL